MSELSGPRICLAVAGLGPGNGVALLGRRLGDWRVEARVVALGQGSSFRSALTLCDHCRGLTFDLWADLPRTIKEAVRDLAARRPRDFQLAIVVASAEVIGEHTRCYGKDPPDLEPGTLVFFDDDQGRCKVIWEPSAAHDEPPWLARKPSQSTEARS